jgi:hypothetical protein
MKKSTKPIVIVTRNETPAPLPPDQRANMKISTSFCGACVRSIRG